MQDTVLAIDEGTTNSKAILVRQDGKIVANGSCPVEIAHPKPGWVEQDADQIWDSTLRAIQVCLEQGEGYAITAIGISNQRESILVWDRKSGAPLGPVITWQCRRSAAACDALKARGAENEVVARTGLPLDPLFPATKMRWLLDTFGSDHAFSDLCVGTIDAWLIWKFSGGKVHACDASNAARTQLYNISEGCWDPLLGDLFDVPLSILPDVKDSSGIFAETSGLSIIPDGIPIASAIGDSHGALFGHGAFGLGDGKITFGTGSSIMTSMPDYILPPKGITTTIAWSLDGKPTFALEGNILVSASILPWVAELLDQKDVTALLDLAQSVEDTQGVMLVPAHVGLGAPYWDSAARGTICGLTFNAGKAHIARAAAESMAFQVHDVFDIIARCSDHTPGRLFVDGGPSRNPFLMQMVADYCDHPIVIGENTEASALGAAYLAGLAVGFWSGLDGLSSLKHVENEMVPHMPQPKRESALKLWRNAISRTVLCL